jgi:hypothetical protein
MRSFTKGLSKLTFTFTLFCFYTSCTEDTPDLGNIEYALRNNSEINVGFKVRLVAEANASIIKDSVIIKPGEELVIIKSHHSQEPKLIIDKIEIWNTEFKSRYKEIELDNYTKKNEGYTLPITMPSINSSEIIKFNTSVHFYLDQTSLFGFYPKVDYPRTTYFFKTPDYFNEIFKTQTPTSTSNADFKMIDVFGSTLIGHNAWSYADKTLFIKSNNGGATWETFFEFGFSTSDDAFTATDFVNENTGWLFNYKTVFNGQFANTYATDVYKYNSGNLFKISTIDKYSIYACNFINENIGYALANTSNNVMPADTRQTIFMKTIDGGVTWSAPVTISGSYTAYKIFRLGNGKLIVFFSPWDSLLKHYMVSFNDGLTWQSESVTTSDGIRDLFFLTNGIGYLKTGTSGDWASQNIGEVYKTLDGGSTWTKIADQMNGSIIWFFDENIGYLQDLIYGQGQILYVTNDGGTTWKEVLYPYDYLIK